MIIKLSDVINQSIISFEYTEKEMDSLELPEGVTIKGTVEVVDGQFLVRGSYRTVLKLVCVKCLTEIEPLVQGDFEGRFLDPKSYAKYISSLKPEEEFGEFHFEEAVNNEINISELVREYIILDLSQYESCIPECTDMSNVEYETNEIDPRWQQLLEIKI